MRQVITRLIYRSILHLHLHLHRIKRKHSGHRWINMNFIERAQSALLLYLRHVIVVRDDVILSNNVPQLTYPSPEHVHAILSEFPLDVASSPLLHVHIDSILAVLDDINHLLADRAAYQDIADGSVRFCVAASVAIHESVGPSQHSSLPGESHCHPLRSRLILCRWFFENRLSPPNAEQLRLLCECSGLDKAQVRAVS